MQEPAQHSQEQLSPKLALVSHALALAATATPAPHLVSLSLSSAAVLGVGVRLVLAWLAGSSSRGSRGGLRVAAGVLRLSVATASLGSERGGFLR
jgi:hypothetical protein